MPQRIRDGLLLDGATLRQGATPADREEAARRLIARQNADGDSIIRDAANANPLNLPAQVAIAKALPDDPTPDAMLIPVLVGMLGVDLPSTQAAAAALASYRDRPEAVRAVIGFASHNDPQGTAVRSAAVRGLGASVDQSAAQTLVDLLQNNNQPPLIRSSAADALVDMTQLRENGHDPAAWQKWWGLNAPAVKPPAQFKADLLDRVKRTRQPAGETEALMQDLYRLVPKDQRPDFLKRGLVSTDAGARAAMVRVARRDAETSGQLAEAVKIRLRAMISDPSAEVRLQVAGMLGSINDGMSLEALLTQLAQEPDPTARIAQVQAVVPMRDPRAVPELLKALDDPSIETAIAVAGALRQMGPLIKGDRVLLPQVKNALQRVMNGRGQQPGGAELRAAAVEALSGLGDLNLGGLFLGLLNPNGNEPPRVRRAAYKGLEELGDPKNADLILRFLPNERDAGVRLAALDALGKVSQFTAAAPTLYGIFGGNSEPDDSVRERAWQVFERLLPSASTEELNDWSGRSFRTDYMRRLSVLKELATRYAAQADQLAAQGKAADATARRGELALTWENIGDAYLHIAQEKKTPASPDAARNFRLALDYWLANNGAQATLESLTFENLTALLTSRQYDAAARFAQETIARNPASQPQVAGPLTNEAERLLNARDFKNALALAAEAKKINPPLDPGRFGNRLASVQVQSEQALQNSPPR